MLRLFAVPQAFLCCPWALTYGIRPSGSTRRPSGLQILNSHHFGCDYLSRLTEEQPYLHIFLLMAVEFLSTAVIL